MNSDTAGAGPVDASVRPAAWMWQTVESGARVSLNEPADYETAHQLEPLFGKAEIETAVAAERERAHNSGFVEASRIHGAEIERLRAREKACETMDHAQKVALVRALQECCEALGLHDMASPAELVAAVRALRA